VRHGIKQSPFRRCPFAQDVLEAQGRGARCRLVPARVEQDPAAPGRELAHPLAAAGQAQAQVYLESVAEA
jgi:hypothetical protein